MGAQSGLFLQRFRRAWEAVLMRGDKARSVALPSNRRISLIVQYIVKNAEDEDDKPSSSNESKP